MFLEVGNEQINKSLKRNLTKRI